MISVFPTEREAKRQVLLDAVDEVRDVLTAGADAAEQMATLPKATVEALYESGLLFLKLPAALGGAEADLLTQLDVFEAVTRIDTSAGWCLLIGSASLGRLGAFLPDEVLDRLFVDGRSPKTCGTCRSRCEARRRMPRRLLWMWSHAPFAPVVAAPCTSPASCPGVCGISTLRRSPSWSVM